MGHQACLFASRVAVAHLTSAYPSYRRRQFARAWESLSKHHDDAWCVRRVDLTSSDAAIRLLGRVDATRGRKGQWFDNVYLGTNRTLRRANRSLY